MPPSRPSPSHLTFAATLGQGWKGIARRGRVAGREQECAILEVAAELAAAAGFAERFSQLGSALEKLEDPGLARYLEFLREDEKFFIVSELAHGLPLKRWLAEQSPPAPVLIERFCASLHSLEVAHGRGIVHLDLTPEQILGDATGKLVICDLGLAALFGPEGRAARHRDPSAAHRVWPYMAPETHDPPARADFRADVFSMGVILYEALCGRVPMGLFDLPSRLNPALDPRIDTIVATALAADPSRRYQRASELASALEHVLAGMARAAAAQAQPAERRSAPPAPVLPRIDPNELATLTLDSDPPGARITDLSGAVFGDTPLVLRLAPGNYSFCFRLPEPYLPVTEDVTLIANSSARMVARPTKRGGEIAVTSAPQGAEVLRAGYPIGVTPFTFPVAEGETGELVLRREGYHDTMAKFEGKSSVKTEVRVNLKPRLAVLQVSSEPVGAEVFDEKGVRIGTAPARLHLDHGPRRLSFRFGKGFEERTLELDLAPGEERQLDAKLTPKPGLVEVTSVPSGATVLRDGQPLGQTSMTLTLPGRQPVGLTLKLAGYKDLEMTVVAEGGVRTVAEGRLELADVPGLEFLGSNGDGFREYKNEKDGSVLIYIPGGTFTRGSDNGDADERPVRTLTLSGFYVGKVPVTNAQYRKFLAETGHRRPATYPGFELDEQPVVGVDWNDAAAYCAWAGLRLPTEAEWEKAARGLDDRTYPWGDQPPLDLIEELKEKLGRRESRKVAAVGLWQKSTDSVGEHPGGASPWGCLDMSGQVWEWCADWHDAGYYEAAPEVDPVGPAKGNERVCRGGAWSVPTITWAEVWERAKESGSFHLEAWRFHVPRLTVTTRGWYQPGYRFNNLGLRVARSHP